MATTLTISILADVAKAVQGIDSIDKRTQSWGQTMKGAATTVGAAFSLNQIKDWASGWVDAGREAMGAIKNVKLVFGDQASQVQAWGDTASGTFGMTAAAAEAAAVKVGVALKGYGFSTDDAAKASEDLVQRSADMAKVLGKDQTEVLSAVESAMRGRTQGLKDMGVQVEAGSTAEQVYAGFMDQTAYATGRADTPTGELHATMGDLSATIGQALVPIINDVIPLFQAVANWAKENHTAFVAIVLVFLGLASAFGIATAAAGLFAVASLAAFWPIIAVVGGVLALVAGIILLIKYWSTLVGWLKTAWTWIQNVGDRFGWLLLLFGGPLGAALWALSHFEEIWHGILKVIEAVVRTVEGLWDKASKLGDLISHIPGVGKIMGGASTTALAGAGVGAYASPQPVAVTVNIHGNVGDPVTVGRRVVEALEAYTDHSGRRRLAAMAAP